MGVDLIALLTFKREREKKKKRYSMNSFHGLTGKPLRGKKNPLYMCCIFIYKALSVRLCFMTTKLASCLSRS